MSPLSFSAVYNLPAPSVRIGLSPPYSPPVLKGIKIDPCDPFHLDFIIGSEGGGRVDAVEAKRLVGYFLACLTTPDADLWVNLSPYEAQAVIPGTLSLTDFGKDMLEEDYILKQLAASLTYPETEAGKKYWAEINQPAAASRGRSNASDEAITAHGSQRAAIASLARSGLARDGVDGVSAFQKVWIVTDKAEVCENGQVALVSYAKFKVLTEEDYAAQQISNLRGSNIKFTSNPGGSKSAQAFKTHVLPLIQNEVDTGARFARLRQMYHAFVLAVWFKQKMRDSLYRHYINRKKIDGIDLSDRNAKDNIYRLYVEAFKKGAYDYVKAERVSTARVHRRQYFSGGAQFLPQSVGVRQAASRVYRQVLNKFRKGATTLSVGLVSVGAKLRPQRKLLETLRLKRQQVAAAEFLVPLGLPVRGHGRSAMMLMRRGAAPPPPASSPSVSSVDNPLSSPVGSSLPSAGDNDLTQYSAPARDSLIDLASAQCAFIAGSDFGPRPVMTIDSGAYRILSPDSNNVTVTVNPAKAVVAARLWLAGHWQGLTLAQRHAAREVMLSPVEVDLYTRIDYIQRGSRVKGYEINYNWPDADSPAVYTVSEDWVMTFVRQRLAGIGLISPELDSSVNSYGNLLVYLENLLEQEPQSYGYLEGEIRAITVVNGTWHVWTSTQSDDGAALFAALSRVGMHLEDIHLYGLKWKLMSLLFWALPRLTDEAQIRREHDAEGNWNPHRLDWSWFGRSPIQLSNDINGEAAVTTYFHYMCQAYYGWHHLVARTRQQSYSALESTTTEADQPDTALGGVRFGAGLLALKAAGYGPVFSVSAQAEAEFKDSRGLAIGFTRLHDGITAAW